MHFLKSHKTLVIIFALALGVRLILLDRFPIGFHVDEAKVGWNAFSILKTGKDDLGNKFALYYNTFGDYRPTGIFYITIPSILLFGLNIFAVRFPSAIFGALTVFPVYFLSLHFFNLYKQKKNTTAALFSALFIALSPWHLFVSRATSEGIISLFFALCALLLFIQFLHSNKKQYFATGISLSLISMLFYHAVRPLMPLLLFAVYFYFWRYISTQTKKYGFLFCILVSIITTLFLLSPSSRGRLSQVTVTKYQDTVLGTHTSKFELPTQIKNEYEKYLGLEFLNGDSPKPYRYRVFGVGLVSFATIVFFASGVAFVAKRKVSSITLFLFLLSPIPAAVTGEDAPNLHRALFMMPFIALIAGYGAFHLFKGSYLKKIFGILFLLWFISSSIFSLVTYFTSGSQDAAPYRNTATEVVTQFVIQNESKYHTIVLTNKPDSFYSWYAFFSNKSPKVFNAFAQTRVKGDWEYKNITFTDNKCPIADVLNNKKLTGKLLVVDAPRCDIEGIQKSHPEVKEMTIPVNASFETQYHVWIREK